MRSHRSVEVARDRNVEAGRLLEQQRRAAAGRLADAIGDGGDLEIGADRLGDARQQLALVEVGEEVVEVGIHIGVAANSRRSRRARRSTQIVTCS